MKRGSLLLFSLMLLFLAGHLHAQYPWSGIIDSSRAIDWSGAGISGGIPSATWTQCGSTIAAYSGTAATITNAIAACSANTYVLLGAGTFHLTTGIDFRGHSNVALRGSGPMNTILKFTGGNGITCTIYNAEICLGGSSQAWTGNTPYGGYPAYTWTGGYSQGSTTLTFNSVSGWGVGDVLILDQDDDSTDTGGVFVGDKSGTYIQEGADEGRTCPDSNNPACSGTSIRLQQEFKRIVSVNSGTHQVTIDTPIQLTNWRTGQHPGGWVPGLIGSNIGTMIGVENLTINSMSESGTGCTNGTPCSNVEIGNCYQCWVKNVRSLKITSQNHVWIYQSARAVVRDSYFFGSGGASQSYGVEFAMGSNNLVENNICQTVVACVVYGNTEGSVFSYNYTENGFFQTVIGYMSQSQNGEHDAATMNLNEGNDVNQVVQDNIHGDSDLQTYFRSRMRGWDTPAPLNATWAFDTMAYIRLANVVGNVLGTAGVHTVYQEVASSGSSNCNTGNQDVFLLAYKTGCVSGGSGSIVNDPLAASTIVRWGNYDVVNGAAQFNCSEVDPAGAVSYSNANSCPSNHTLPSSFYLSSQPSWWTTAYGTPAFPAIGPDVSGGTAPDGLVGHAYSIPSQLCFNNASIDTAYQTTYTITGGSWSSGTETLTIGSNSLATGTAVTISGATPSAINRAVLVTAVTGTTFSFPLASNPGTVSGGTVGTPNIRQFDANVCYIGQPLIPPAGLQALVH